MKSRYEKQSETKARQVYVKSPKLRPKITYLQVTVPKQEPKLVHVRVRTPKENTDANSKNKSTQAKGRPAKS